MSYNLLYFKDLAAKSSTMLDGLPIPLSPQTLEYSLNKLKPAIDLLKDDYINVLGAIEKEASKQTDGARSVGLNTIGMLTDRFTILLIREWCIRNKNKDITKADTLFDTQTVEIMKAMSESQPGYSSLNSKITHIKANAEAGTWEAAYFGLLTTNLILWESQEILYIKDINALPAEEIRDYIKWFSYGNILRNEYIELCELLYWKQFEK